MEAKNRRRFDAGHQCSVHTFTLSFCHTLLLPKRLYHNSSKCYPIQTVPYEETEIIFGIRLTIDNKVYIHEMLHILFVSSYG